MRLPKYCLKRSATVDARRMRAGRQREYKVLEINEPYSQGELQDSSCQSQPPRTSEHEAVFACNTLCCFPGLERRWGRASQAVGRLRVWKLVQIRVELLRGFVR